MSHSSRRGSVRTGLLIAASLLAGAILATAATGAGRTDRLAAAPFYRDYGRSRPAGNVLVLPVRLDPISTGGAGDGARDAALGAIADALDRHVASLGWVRTVDAQMAEQGAPTVYVGSAEGEYAPPEAAMLMTEHDDRPPMVIHLQKPSARWSRDLATLLAEHRADGALLLHVGFSEFPKTYRKTFRKQVVLGTGYQTDIRFLSAELEPVHVLLVSGVLLDRDGRVVRGGAEGILSEDTPFWAQSFRLRKEIEPATVLRLLEEERREDLPDRPLTWRVAVDNLLAQLLGDEQRLVR